MSVATFLTLKRSDHGIALLEVDAPNEAVNTLRAESSQQFQEIFDKIAEDKSITGVILCSNKEDNFIAGADISMLDGIGSAEEGASLSKLGQAAASRIAACDVPVVAAIHGACLGGGLELALACHGRVASLHDKTKLGLPEVQLGILPGMGGTWRLPRTIGLTHALDMLLTGRQVSARRALTMGLISAAVEPASLMNAALELMAKLQAARKRHGGPWRLIREALDPDAVVEAAIAENPIGRKVVFDQARKELLKKTHGNYPAPERILSVVRRGLEKGLDAGLEAEALAFGELVISNEAQALRHVYFAQQAVRKYDGPPSNDEIIRSEKIAVIGAGLMGQGIAAVSLLQAKTAVRLKDTSRQQLSSAAAQIDGVLKERVSRRRMTAWEHQQHLARLTLTTDNRGISNCDVVIEAVFEDLELKQAILKQVESDASTPTIFASNTSALMISEIARHASHKERVIGLHYFSPVEKMPLLEIVVTNETAPWVVRTAIELGKRQGKTVIVVHDSPGFYTTRILASYLNEAAHVLMEGHAIDEIDRQLVSAGFPVGPFTLLDEIGIDVGYKVGKSLFEALGDRLKPPAQLDRLVAGGRLGKKSKRGFYSYVSEQSGARPVDASFYEELDLAIPKPEPSAEKTESASMIVERCLLSMVNEAAHCLDAGVLRSTDDGDIGAIFGLGFPAHLGGPFHYIKQVGADEIVSRLSRLQESYGARFEPAPYLRSLSRESA